MRSRDVSAGQTARPDQCVARRKFQFAAEQLAAHQPRPYRRPSRTPANRAAAGHGAARSSGR